MGSSFVYINICMILLKCYLNIDWLVYMHLHAYLINYCIPYAFI